jgi:hypothetical protein
LYVASGQLRSGELDAAYREILRLTWEMASPYLDAMQVKLVPASDLIAQAALEINHRFPGRIPARLGGTTFGGMGVDEPSLDLPEPSLTKSSALLCTR